jgi:adenylate cyclase, class 2
MEVEIRALVDDVNSLSLKLNELGQFKERSHQIDTYLKHVNDDQRRLVVRFRRSGNSTALLTFKGSSVNSHDNNWADYDTVIADPDSLQELLLSNGFEHVCEINKKRNSYLIQGFEVNVDEIANLGIFIEVESIVACQSEVSKALEELHELFNAIGIKNEKVINSGYVKLMLDKTETK